MLNSFANWIKDNPWLSGFSALAVGVLVYLLVRYGKQLRQFCGESVVELQKCSWPWDPQAKGFAKYRELRDSTVVVVISSILLATYVTSADFLLMQVVGFLTRFNF